MTAPVTVVTPTIPTRRELLVRCMNSVDNQTVPVESHLIMSQPPIEGMQGPVHCAHQQNHLLPSVRTEWTMRLADDDLLLPQHIEILSRHFADADVIYSYDANHDRPRTDCTSWGQEWLVNKLAETNWIDGSAVAIRTDLLRAVGGWPTMWTGGNHLGFQGHFVGMKANADDWACFYRLAQAGARFHCVPQGTWMYGNGNWPRLSTGG